MPAEVAPQRRHRDPDAAAGQFGIQLAQGDVGFGIEEGVNVVGVLLGLLGQPVAAGGPGRIRTSCPPCAMPSDRAWRTDIEPLRRLPTRQTILDGVNATGTKIQ